LNPIGALIPWLSVCCVFALTAVSAAAQDLFELEVFEFDTAAPGSYELGIHTNGLPRGDVRQHPVAGAHRPVHVSLEITRGWTSRFETAAFVQTAPFGPARSTRFAGGHARAKIRLTDSARLPFRFGVSAEYGFNRASFDDELQTLEIRPIIDRRKGRLSLILNPGLELVMRGSDTGLDPSFDVSARAAWSVSPRLSINGEYFSKPASTRHLEIEDTAHHLVFSGIDVAVADEWEVSLGAGHCVTSHEPWVFRSMLSYRFGN